MSSRVAGSFTASLLTVSGTSFSATSISPSAPLLSSTALISEQASSSTTSSSSIASSTAFVSSPAPLPSSTVPSVPSSVASNPGVSPMPVEASVTSASAISESSTSSLGSSSQSAKIDTASSSTATPGSSAASSTAAVSANSSQSTSPTSKQSSNSASKAAASTPTPSNALSTSSENVDKPNQSVPAPSPSDVSNSSIQSAASTTIHVVQVSTTISGTATSTITDQPDSTLSSVISITSVNTSDGKTTVEVPPLVTLLSTSVDSAGESVIYTHVVANPTGTVNGATGSSTFFQNQGKVAGVFLVVGIVAASLAATLYVCIRRYRRKSRRARGFQTRGIFFDHPQPAYAEQDAVWDGNRGALLPVSGSSPPPAPRMGEKRPESQDAGFSDHNPFRDPDMQQVGLAITTNDRELSRVSLTPSSPSIYPPSLPLIDEEEDRVVSSGSFVGPAYGNTSPSSSSAGSPVDSANTDAPQRPPRSLLRESTLKRSLAGIYPMTPPPSLSSDSHSLPSSPISETSNSTVPNVAKKLSHEEIFSRKTLLDVRPKRPTTS